MKKLIAASLITLAALSYSSSVNADRNIVSPDLVVSPACTMRVVVDNVVLICPKKDSVQIAELTGVELKGDN